VTTALLGNASAPQQPYTLPDGSALALGPERFRAGEVLFHPALAGVDAPGVGDLLAGALGRADLELRPALAGAIVLSGGATKTPGFGARLLAEARRAAPPGAKTRVFAPAERELLPWLGGSILGSLSTFSRLAVTKAQWAEEGPNAVHKNAL